MTKKHIKAVIDEAVQYGKEHGTRAEVVWAVAAATNANLTGCLPEREGEPMCTLFEEIAKENQEIGRARGIIEGEREGRIAGERAERNAFAGNLKKAGIEIEKIVVWTGLSREEVLAL